MFKVFLEQNQSYRTFSTRLNGHPGWVLRWAFLAGTLVMVIPMFVFVTAGLLVGAIVFIILSLVAKLMNLLGLGQANAIPAEPDPDLRRNVRVVEED